MSPSRVLTHDEARHFYDRFGAKQDSQAFYERPALERLLSHLELQTASAVLEFGCGTGRLAAELLGGRLRPECRYLGLDLSSTMVELARARLAAFAGRAEIRLTDGRPRIDAPGGSFDRFVSTYVFDLLAEEEIRALLAEAHRVLLPGGRLGIAGLTQGESFLASALTRVWRAIHRLRPSLVGGCRPLDAARFLDAARWRLLHRSVVSPYAVASEVVVAERI
jgi:cyclopropane fatty-acyl-phospholipid synthase-like methyltransferase